MGFMDPFRMAASAKERFADAELQEAPKALPASAYRPLTASGQKINLRSSADVYSLKNRISTEWQNDAWAYYDAIGEVKFAFLMASNVVSRIRLYPALNFEQDAVPTSVDSYRDRTVGETEREQNVNIRRRRTVPQTVTEEVLDEAERLTRELLNSGSGGQSSIMRMFALNMFVAGECFLLKYKGDWVVRSSHEITVGTSGEVIMRTQRHGQVGPTAQGNNASEVILPKGTAAFRIWREHPRFSAEPDSSMMSVREICEEVIVLQRQIRTIARSRMHAGILYVPDGLSAAGASIAEDIAAEEEEMDALVASLYDSITAPIADETNAASVVPNILTGPSEFGQHLRYLPMERSVDQYLVERLDKAMGRLLNGLDVPRDMVEGMSGLRYSNAQTMNGHMYQSQIEPMVLMFCDALTAVYLRPMLKKKFPHLSKSDLDYFTFWYDPSEVVTKSDPSASADKGLDAFAISTDVWRKAHGFSDSDAPNEAELALRYLLTKAPPQPDMIAMLFKMAFPGVVDAAREAHLTETQVPMPESAQTLLYGKVVVTPEETEANLQNGPGAQGNPPVTGTPADPNFTGAPADGAGTPVEGGPVQEVDAADEFGSTPAESGTAEADPELLPSPDAEDSATGEPVAEGEAPVDEEGTDEYDVSDVGFTESEDTGEDLELESGSGSVTNDDVVELANRLKKRFSEGDVPEEETASEAEPTEAEPEPEPEPETETETAEEPLPTEEEDEETS